MAATKRKPPNPSSSKPTTLPTPFQPAPTSLESITTLLDPSKIHITHLDHHPIPQKRTIFLIPVLLNLFIAALLCWRLYHAVPTYYILFLTLIGNRTAASVDTLRTTFRSQIWVLTKRVGMMAGDYLFFGYVGPWPTTFFFEQPANPCSYRWKVGFREEEVIVRISRGWGAEELVGGKKRGGESAFWKTRVETAVEREQMGKVGYLMMDRDWDLEFEGMGMVEALVAKGEVGREELDGVVWAYVEGAGWGVWKFGGEGDGDTDEERRREVVRFQEVLVAMGKEGLFWKWTEIVEEERGSDGGFTEEGRRRVEERVKAEFEKEGVDFEELKRRVGGRDGKGVVPMPLPVPIDGEK